MFAHVKYLDAEGSYCNVPITFIKPPFDHNNFNPNVTYEVFWSPEEEDRPDNLSIKESTPAVSKDGIPKAGYYKAIVLLVADDEELLEEKLKERRIRVMPEKFLTSPHLSRVDGDLKSMKSNKKDSKKIIKESSDKGRTENLKRLESVKANNVITERRTKRKLKSLFEPQSSKSDSDRASLSSEDNSEDDVVPKKFLVTSESQLKNIKEKYYELQKKYSFLKEEKECYKTKYRSLESKYSDLDVKYNNLLELNSQMQHKILDYFEKSTAMFPETKRTIPIEQNTPHTLNKVKTSTTTSLSLTLPLTPQNTSENKNKTNSPSGTWAYPLDELENVSDVNQNEEITLLNIQTVESSPTENHSQDVDFTLSKDKLNAAKLNIKKGIAGDSQYAKNLATALWSSHILAQRSVSGRKGNYKGDGQAKPRLTPQKVDYLRDLFNQRLHAENPNISEDEVQLRSRNIPTYISQKISTLKRVVMP